MTFQITSILVSLTVAGLAWWLMYRWMRVDVPKDDPMTVKPERLPDVRNEAMPPDIRQRLGPDLRLACEHLESLQILIQVAVNHKQGVPASVLTNLGFVSRHLRRLEQHVAQESGEDIRLPVRETLPKAPKDAGFHVFRCDKSTLSG